MAPRAQGLAGRLAAPAEDDGFTDDEIDRDLVPVATHNQRGLGTLHVGCPEAWPDVIDALVLLRIVEDSMSSEIYATKYMIFTCVWKTMY